MPSTNRTTFSVSRAAYDRFSAAARDRGVTLGGLVDLALVGEWSTVGVRSTAEVSAEICRARQGGAQRFFAERDAEALAAMPSTHRALEQRCSLDVSLGALELVDDRVTRLAELHGVEVSRAELFDRAVNAALDLEGAP